MGAYEGKYKEHKGQPTFELSTTNKRGRL